MITTVYDNWGRSFTLPGDYDDFPRFFRLQHLTVDDSGAEVVESELFIREPAGWDSVKLSLSRDDDWYGVDYEVSVGETALFFDLYSGGEFIRAIFGKEGEDATIVFHYGTKKDNATYIVEYEGRLLLSTRKKQKGKIGCTLERKTLSSLVRSRWETSVNLFSGVDLDGKASAAPDPALMPLTPQAIGERFESVIDAGKRTEQTITGDADGHVWIQFDTSQPQTAEITEFTSGRPAGFASSDGPLVNEEWLFKFSSGGLRTIEIEQEYRLWVSVKKRSIGLTKAKLTGYSLNTWLVLKRADKTEQKWAITVPLAEGTIKQPASKNYSAPDIGVTATTTNAKLSVSVETAPGDKLYWYGAFLFTHNLNELGQTQVTMQTITQRFTIKGLTENKGTLAQGLTPETALSSALRLTSGQSDALRSAYYGMAGTRYGVNGPGSLRFLATGYHIRGFKQDPTNILRPYPFGTSLQALMKGLQAIDGVGRSFTKEVSGNTVRDVVRVEPMRYFFRDVLLMDLGEVSDYSEDTVKEELYSKIDVGYSKWVDEGAGAMEEFLGKTEVSLPIRHEFGSASFVSDLVASSLAIEKTRREQFADKPRDSTTYDESVFVIACQTPDSYSGTIQTIYSQAAFGIRTAFVRLPAAVPWIVSGGKITINGGPYTSVTLTVVGTSDVGATPWTFAVLETSSVVNAVVTSGTISASSSLIPETGADLEGVRGLIAADSTYNIRLSPARNLLRNTPRWAGCLAPKPGTALLQKAKLPQNGAVVSRIAADTPMISERGAIAVDELRPSILIAPRLIRCSKRLSWDQIQTLRLALQGLLPVGTDNVDRNYGFLSLNDDEGEPVTGWIEQLDYQPATGKAVFQIRQSALDLIDTLPDDCDQYAGWSLAQVETADAQTRRRIELCRYADLDSL